MSRPNFEKNLETMLHRAVDAIPASTDLSRTVQRRLQEQSGRGDMRQSRLPNQAIASLSALLVIALIGGLLIYAHSHQSSLSAIAPLPGITGQVHPTTDKGVTLQVLHAYADSISTTVQVSISGTDTNLFNPSLEDPTIIDALGNVYSTTTGGGGYTGADPTHTVGNFEFLPFPASQLQSPLHLTFTVHHVREANGKPSSVNDGTLLEGIWQSSFTLNPVAGTIYQSQTPSIVNQGIGLRVESIEVAPATQTVVGQRGGVRLILTMTGVPADTLLESFSGWQPTTSTVNSRGLACAPGQCPAQVLSTSALLMLPGFAPYTDGTNGLLSIAISPRLLSASQTAGPTGIVQMELLYQGQGDPSGDPGTLIVSNFHILVAGTPKPIVKETLPQWQFTVSLR